MKKTISFGLYAVAAGLLFVRTVYSNDLFISGEAESNGLSVVVSAPDGFTDRVEIYACSDLISNSWRIVTQNLRPTGDAPAKWYAETTNDSGFFIVGNMDMDNDGDGLPDARERFVHKTSPSMWDSDGDWMPDNWELTNALNALVGNAAGDADGDGLSNGAEYQRGTNPFNTDSDSDGIPDVWEVNNGTNPQANDAADDPDSDGLVNHDEYTAGTNPFEPDADGDGIPDGFEVSHGMNPRDPHDVLDDLDGDFIPNLYEYLHDETDPSNPAAVPAPTAVVSTNGHDGTFTNIQDAADAVATNEYPIILIEPGNYSVAAEVTLTPANILIYAEPQTVVLDGGGSNRLFNMVSGWPILAGLVMQNGYSADDGGAIYISEAKPVVRNCLFLSNRSDGNGGAIYSGGYALEAVNCVFKDNEALKGGAVYCENEGPELKHCTWIDNHAFDRGGAIYNGAVINGVVWSNRADVSGAQIHGAAVSYSCVEGGYSGVSNTTNNPQLAHIWHLASVSSPCVNSGDATSAAQSDLDREPRDLLPDMGADEWMDSDADGVPDWWEIQWFTNLNTITAGNLPADDADGRFSYIQKYRHEMNPYASDADSDGLLDYAEIYIYKTDPLVTNALYFPVSYVMEQASYDWVDISQTGQAITNFYNLDDGSAQISIGFQFPLFGAAYDTAYVCNNGFVSFGGSSTEYVNEPLPSDQIPENTLCVFWDDFRMGNDTNSAVYIQSVSNQCVISFEGMPFWDSWRTNRLSFQIILKDDGSILYQYKNVSSDDTLPTVGIQWGGGSVEFYAGSITNGTALLIHADGLNADFDLDGVRDVWEKEWFGSLNTVTNGSDFMAGTNRFIFAEAAYLGLNPNETDTDGDGLSDSYEVENGLNPAVPQDTDGDGIPDFYETVSGLNVSDPSDALLDLDEDDFPNVYEYRHNTDPFNAASVPVPTRYVSLSGTHTAPFTNSTTAAINIQAVLATASAYDIIQIADGTYTGAENKNLRFTEKPVMIFSENGPENCILDCENEGRGLSVESSAAAGSMIKGVQFYRCYSDWAYGYDSGYGGATYCVDTRVLFENCRWRSSDASNRGGAVYGQNASVIFKNCVFEDNGTDSVGGAGYFQDNSSIELLNCTITGTLGSEGIVCFESDFLIQNSVFSNNLCCALYGELSSGQIKNSTFSDNHVQSYSGGLDFYYADVILSNCVFRNNSVELNGLSAGAVLQEHTDLKAQNCFFSGNRAGSGVIYVGSGSAWLQNCTFFSNQCPAIYRYYFGDITIRNTILWENESGSYNSAEGFDIEFCCLPEMAGTNNIHTDPKLVAETGALLPNSPCIDRGSDSTAPAADMAATPRWDHPWRSNGVDVSIADIGAVEFTDSDSDADGLGDKWEIYYFTNITFSSGADDDSDGLSTLDEYKLNTNPALADTDGDTLSDGDEVSTYGTDPLNSDSDRDGLSDADEINTYETDPLQSDSDHDGLPDGWETNNGLNPLSDSDAAADADSDGLSNLSEYTLGMDIHSSDSDNDGLPDAWEVANSLNPLVDDSASDPDSDGVNNLAEYQTQTDPQDMDNDDDGMPNAWETAYGLDLTVDDASGDPDSDGLSNLEEYQAGTNPHLKDTDIDKLSDYDEIHVYSTNPADDDTDGDGIDDWFEMDQGRDPLTDESALPENLPEEPLAKAASYSSDVLADDFDDDGQLNVDELHRYPSFTLEVSVDELATWPAYTPVDFLFKDATVRCNTWPSMRWTYLLETDYAKAFFAEPGKAYQLDDLFNISVPPANQILQKRLYLSGHFSWSGGVLTGYLTENDLGTYIYPYSCDYRIESGFSGAYDRRMSILVNDDDDNDDGIPDCNNEVIDSPADTNDMALVVFEQMVIHPSAPSPHIYLSASPEVRLFRASNGQPIHVYRHGEPWTGEEDDIANDLRNGDFAVLIEGVSPSSLPDQTADDVAGYSFFPPFYGPDDPTSQGSWGTYVGLYCKEDVDRYSYYENDAIRFSVNVIPRIKLIPDWNRDRQINGTDEAWNTNSAPFCFWINDDNDSGDIAEGDSDIPGQGGSWWPWSRDANYEDSKVNGRSDLTDFFPVWLDIASALTNYPSANGFTYRLSQADGALQFVYTSLENMNAGDYLITDVGSCGSLFSANVYTSDTVRIASTGTVLNVAFLNLITADLNNGILLMEATRSSDAPLILEVLSNDTVIAQTELPLSLSGVEDMYRFKNLRGSTERNRNNAPNWPDQSSTNIIFVHGNMADLDGARAWSAEVFKRLWWSGGNYRFHGIAWTADEGLPTEYQRHVARAFETAPQFASYVNGLQGDVIVVAQSLGNVLVGSAIQDHSMNHIRYYMIDAAVPLEAYDASVAEPAHPHLVSPEWIDYPTNSWSANWFKLFQGQNDIRASLKWRGRFSNTVSKAYNIYSSSDEVFDTAEAAGVFTDPGLLPGGTQPFFHYCWQNQELLKGVKGRLFNGALFGLGSTDWAGWGFNLNLVGWRQYSAAQAAEALQNNPQSLIPKPVFRADPELYFHVTNLTREKIDEMLAKGIPALSIAAGRSACGAIIPDTKNIDLNTAEMRPNGTIHTDNRWYHNDMKDLPYLQTYKLYEILAQ